MSYIYLLNLYKEIEKRFQQIDSLYSDKSERTNYTRGQIEILTEFKKYLTSNLNNKLPKKIRKNLSDKTQKYF